MSPLLEAECPTTAERLLVHGANAVCEVPRPHPVFDPLTVSVLVLSGVLAAGLAAALRPGRLSRTRAAVLLVGAALLAGPGLYAVWVVRGDAPLHVRANAAQVAGLEHQLDSFAAARGRCVEVVRNDCEACEPIVRFVLPEHTGCGPAKGKIDLRSDALGGCSERGDTLQCGNAG